MAFSFSFTCSIARANMIGMSLASLVYGLHVSFFVGTVRRWSRIDKYRNFFRTYVILLFVTATVAFALHLRWNVVAFIDNWNYPGGPLVFLQRNVHSPLNLAVTILYLFLNWLADGMLLFRFDRVCKGHRAARTVAISILLTQIALGSLFVPEIAALCMNLWIDAPTAPAIAYLTLTLSLNVLVMMFIALRLILFNREMGLGTMVNPPRPYGALAWRIFQIAAPVTFVSLFGIITCGINSPLQNVFLPILGQLQAIPPLLVTMLALENRNASSTSNTLPRSMTYDLDLPPEIKEPTFLRRCSSALSLKTQASLPKISVTCPGPTKAPLRSPIVDRPDSNFTFQLTSPGIQVKRAEYAFERHTSDVDLLGVEETSLI